MILINLKFHLQSLFQIAKLTADPRIRKFTVKVIGKFFFSARNITDASHKGS